MQFWNKSAGLKANLQNMELSELYPGYQSQKNDTK